jgi:hypothetical protein
MSLADGQGRPPDGQAEHSSADSPERNGMSDGSAQDQKPAAKPHVGGSSPAQEGVRS